MTALVDAIAFLTRLPVRGSRPCDLARAIRFFPVVGAGLGTLQWMVIAVLVAVADIVAAPAIPPWVLAGAIVLCNVWITGAMHLDALADTVDGFGGGRTREDILRIMRDHAVGSYGAVALIVALGLRAMAVVEIVRGNAFAWLVVAPALARATTGVMAVTLPGARPDGLGSTIAGKVSPSNFAFATAIAMAIAWTLLGTNDALLALGCTIAITAGMIALCRRGLGGTTGDTMGASIEICEVALLVLGAMTEG